MPSAPEPSPATRELTARARQAAARLQHEFIGSEHLLLAVMQSPRPELLALFKRMSVDPAAVEQRLAGLLLPGQASIPEDDLELRTGARKVLDLAATEARNVKAPAVEPEHVFLALLRDRRGAIQQALAETGANLDLGRKELSPQSEPPSLKREPPTSKREPAPAARERPRTEPAARPPAPAPKPPVEPSRPRTPRTPDVPRAAILAHRNPVLTWRNLLLLAVPASIALKYMHASPVLIFTAACLAVLPLAGYMGEATEHLSQRTGPAIGGLLNATFGNAAELIIAIAALQAGLVDLVKASITGSILGNLLLILGLSLIAGSTGQPIIRFNRTAAGMSAAMLSLAVVGLVFPALFHSLHPGQVTQGMYLSEGVAIILGITYVCSLVFALKTHNSLFVGDEHGFPGVPWGISKAMIILAVATVAVAVESEILVHSVEAVTATLGLSQMFLGLIIIPIIGNAAEHATAVMVARKGKMDLALNIALGSSTQVALLVAPLLVLAGVILGQRMDLIFRPFEVAAIAMATIVTAIITLDGESHWFEGVQLLAVYAMVAVAAFFI
ncbi:MAG: calcium/proton exchanger [Gemmatimonadota bacterium]